MPEVPDVPGGEESRLTKARRVATRMADTTVEVVAGADAVIRQAGFTTRSGRISKAKLGMAALRPRRSSGRIIRAAATEIDRRRRGGGTAGARPGAPGADPGASTAG